MDSVRVIDVPERTGSSASAGSVDLVAEVADNLISLEHTLLESYVHQIRDGARIERFIGMVKASLADDLPPGTLTLAMDTDVVGGLTGKAAETAAEEVATWIMDQAQHLAAEDPDDRVRLMRRTANPLPLVLWYRPGDEPCQIRFGRWVPQQLDELRREKLAMTMGDKLPKLHETRKQGASPCLVLEIQDISLSDTDVVVDIGPAVLERFSGLEPDRIVVVVTLKERAFSSIVYESGEWIDASHWQDAEYWIPDEMTVELGLRE